MKIRILAIVLVAAVALGGGLPGGAYLVHAQSPHMLYVPGVTRGAQGAPLSGDEILIPAGPFQMGCDENNLAESCRNHEKPLHTVYLDAYYIDKYSVTNVRYQACELAGVCSPPNDTRSNSRRDYYINPFYANYSVIHIDWFQAETFCAWEGKRLPTEAEWEKAARGPNDTRTYPWGDESPTYGLANYYGPIRGRFEDTREVGSHLAGASPYGVMDMAGNVWEWVNDWFDEAYYSQSPAANPQGPADGEFRVLRGGSWAFSEDSMRNADRGKGLPVNSSDFTGFRCALSP